MSDATDLIDAGHDLYPGSPFWESLWEESEDEKHYIEVENFLNGRECMNAFEKMDYIKRQLNAILRHNLIM